MECRANRDIVLAAAMQTAGALQHASAALKIDREIVMVTQEFDNADYPSVVAKIAQQGAALQHLSVDLRANREVVMVAGKQSGRVLQHALVELRANHEIVLAVVCIDPGVPIPATWDPPEQLRYASEALQDEIGRRGKLNLPYNATDTEYVTAERKAAAKRYEESIAGRLGSFSARPR